MARLGKLLKKLKKAQKRKLKAYADRDPDQALHYRLRERDLEEQIRNVIGPPATEPLPDHEI